uniref:MARVEL domain-containing protein n=1 Tax=Macrostomum lignano TaxID=282301 RepID=A0A1I8FHC7_9PLAT
MSSIPLSQVPSDKGRQQATAQKPKRTSIERTAVDIEKLDEVLKLPERNSNGWQGTTRKNKLLADEGSAPSCRTHSADRAGSKKPGVKSFKELVVLVAETSSISALNAVEQQLHIGNPVMRIFHNHQPAPRAGTRPRTVEAYPPDLFTLAQKQSGAILIHAFVSAWLFVALAIVASPKARTSPAPPSWLLAAQHQRCWLQSLASSSPRATSVSAPIVGSAIFNDLMIVSLCGLAATSAVYLSWWPLFRDCGLLLHKYESVISAASSILAVLYIVVMAFNNRIDAAISKRRRDDSRRVMDDDELAETVAGQQQQAAN